MRLHQIIPLLEGGRRMPCIVVDIQPAYHLIPGYLIDEIMTFLNNQTGPILSLNNLTDHEDEEFPNRAYRNTVEIDTVEDVKEWWINHKFNAENLDRVRFYNKGFWYLRDWMANMPEWIIIKAIQEMYRQRVSRSEELDKELMDKQLLETIIKYWDESLEGLAVNWLPISLLKRYSPCYLMGAYDGRCLSEVQLMMNAFNIKYKRIKKFIK